MEIEGWKSRTGIPNLEGNELVVHHHLLRQKIGADRGLVLIAELLVDILVHQAGLTDAAVAQDDDLQQNLLSRGHVWSWSLKKDSKADGCSLVSLLFLKKKSLALPVRAPASSAARKRRSCSRVKFMSTNVRVFVFCRRDGSVLLSIRNKIRSRNRSRT
jgi:hypothetical protein